MTAGDFRRLALALPEAVEGVHVGHPDFRVGGKVFATLAYPDGGWGMVKLLPEEQEVLVQAAPEVLRPPTAPGGAAAPPCCGSTPRMWRLCVARWPRPGATPPRSGFVSRDVAPENGRRRRTSLGP